MSPSVLERAKGLLSEYQPKYLQGAKEEQLQWVAWKRLLAFEKYQRHRTMFYQLKSLTLYADSELLRYAYAELEESRGSFQPAKKTCEGLLKDPTNRTALSHIHTVYSFSEKN
ncbi:hypothetical protein POM88_003964 [Heracleum sosnowskyi]|uniref:Uncharacterized protein n=1 Tax=Heracleum sosnowskyi TaxID=360622 RepID=A0AAD8NC48_9APIA|nr:hypothetical protein POM88_003964 [Heracleum sosnowskyi]